MHGLQILQGVKITASLKKYLKPEEKKTFRRADELAMLLLPAFLSSLGCTSKSLKLNLIDMQGDMHTRPNAQWPNANSAFSYLPD